MALKDSHFENILEKLKTQGELSFFKEKIIARIDEVSRNEKRLQFYIIICVIAYFLIKKSSAITFQLGPLSISDLELALVLIPPIYTYLLISFHSHYNFRQIQVYNLESILKKDKDFSEEELTSSISILSPFHFFKIYNYIDFTRSLKLSSLNFLLILPSIVLIPLFYFGFEIYWFYELYKNWDTNILFKASMVITAWLFLTFLVSSVIAISDSIANVRRSKETS